MSADATSGEYVWEGDRVSRWLAQAHGLDRQLTPVSDVLFAAAALASGERVLDVGCGHGPTTRRAASEVGPYGRITGLDISSDMVEAAEGIESSSQAATIDWVAADVTGWEAPFAHDAVISRFGVMFFDDPVAAFSSIAAATAPGGRLCIAVWGPRQASELFEVPYRTAAATLTALGLAYEEAPTDRGPYSLCDRERTTALLEGSGWGDVGWAPHKLSLPAGGGMTAEAAGAVALDFGPARLITPEAPTVRQQVIEAITDAYRDHLDADGHVVLGGQVVVVTAQKV